NQDGLVAFSGLFQPFDLRSGVYFFRIEEFAAKNNHVIGRGSDIHIIITEFEIKLTWTGIGLNVPPDNVVVNSYARKPLCNSKYFTVLGFQYTCAVCTMLRYGICIIDVNGCFTTATF